MPRFVTPWLKSTSLAVLAALAVTACSAHPAGTSTPTPASVSLAQATQLDRDTFIQLSASTLADAMQAGHHDVVSSFVAYADGADPDPTATRDIARLASTRLSRQHDADIARIAAGHARVRAAIAATGIHFPQDEAAHPFAITEWWYLNGHLADGSGKTYGYEYTLFKIGPLLHWAHVTVTDQHGQTFSYNREWVPPWQAANATDRLKIQYAQQALDRNDDGSYTLAGDTGTHKLALALVPRKKPLLIDGNGKIDMPEGKDSWYYSITRLAVTGTLDGAPITGISWMDHQWGPFWVSGLADRWDWFSLQFDDNTEYNLFGFRSADGQAGARHFNESRADGSGTVGHEFKMDRNAWWHSPHTGMYYTTAWHIDLPDSHESAELSATNVDQELWRTVPFFKDPLPNYWEGSMQATKTDANGKQVAGVAYCEHFGFATPSGPH